MGFKERINKLVSDLENRIARLKQNQKKAKEKEVNRKISNLWRAMRLNKVAGNVDLLEEKLSALKEKYESNELGIEEVEEEVDQIYGDQSQNSTYYFTKEGSSEEMDEHSKKWISFQENFEMTLEEIEEEVDRFYGDQGENETFYSGRNSSSGEDNWYDKKK